MIQNIIINHPISFKNLRELDRKSEKIQCVKYMEMKD